MNPHHFLAGGQARFLQDSARAPWTGDYVFSSGDLVEDLTHNFFLETGARNNKLKVYEMVPHPRRAHRLPARARRRAPARLRARGREADRRRPPEDVPTPRILTAKIPECQPHIEAGEHLKLYRFSPKDYQEIVAVFTGRTRRPARTSWSSRAAGGRAAGRPAAAAGRVRARLRPGGDLGECRSSARRQPADEPLGEVANGGKGVVEKVKDS